MADISLSGLASGVDTAGIVSQLMALERQGATRAQYRRTHVEARANGLKDIQGRLAALKSAAAALRDASTWAEKQTVESSEPARIGVTRTGGAPIGGYSIRVTQVAASAQKSYRWTEHAEATTLTLDDDDPATAPVQVAIGAKAKIADVAAAINGRGGSPVYAAVVGGDKLVLSSRATGEDAEFSATGTGLGAPENAVAGKDAKYFIGADPEEKSSPGNVLDGVIPGVTLTLKGTTSTAATVTVGAPGVDADAVKAKVRAFVDAYNAVVTLARGELSETRVASPASSFEATRGALFGDTGVSSLLSRLRLQVGTTYDEIGNAGTLDDLGDIGISSGKPGASLQQAKSGLLELDEAKLSNSLASDSEAVRRLLGGASTRAFAQDFEKLADDLDRVLDGRTSSIDAQIRRMNDDLARVDTRLAAREKRLKAQFAAMEKALGAAQTQQSWLTGQLSSLGASNRSA